MFNQKEYEALLVTVDLAMKQGGLQMLNITPVVTGILHKIQKDIMETMKKEEEVKDDG